MVGRGILGNSGILGVGFWGRLPILGGFWGRLPILGALAASFRGRPGQKSQTDLAIRIILAALSISPLYRFIPGLSSILSVTAGLLKNPFFWLFDDLLAVYF